MSQNKQDKTKIVQIWGNILDEGFTSVPNILLKYRHNIGIKAQHLTLVIDIMSFKWDTDNPFPSYSTLAKRAGVAERTIKRVTQDLEELDLLIRTPRFDNKTGAQITTIFDFRPLVEKLTEEVEKSKANKNFTKLPEEGDAHVTGRVSEISRGGMTNMSPKEYTNNNKTKINKNPKGKELKNTPRNNIFSRMNAPEKERVRKDIRNSIYRNRIFETFDNLHLKLDINELVQEGAYKACREIVINRINNLNSKFNLEGIDPFDIANNVKRKFPYDNIPKSQDNIRKFFVAKICDITSEEIIYYLENNRN